VAATTDQIEEIIDGEAHQYYAYGLVCLTRGIYSSPGGAKITLDIYRMPSAADAFGAYSLWREGKDVQPIGAEGYQEGGEIDFYKGRRFVRVKVEEGEGEGLNSLARALADQTTALLPSETVVIPHLSLLPQSGMEANSVRYVKKDFRAQDFLSNAVAAKYRSGKATYECFICAYDNPADAGAALRKLTAATASSGSNPSSVACPELDYQDEFEGRITVIQAGRYLVGATAGRGQVARDIAWQIIKKR
jgi:hypothetical protein